MVYRYHRPDESIGGRRKGSRKTATAVKTFRAATALVVFGVPLATCATALLGYGVLKAYKRITGSS
jgi:hypothetical protein